MQMLSPVQETATIKTIKLRSPSLPNTTAPFVIFDEQKLDLGSIARTFGIVPATLKLNGHFISRGVDLISSSVTWKSLLSFFSARGFSTGQDDARAIVVDGKLCKAGSKRSYDHQGIESENPSIIVACVNRTPLVKVMNLIKKKRLCKRDLGFIQSGLQVTDQNGACFKRKQFSEDLNHQLKKLKVNEINLGISPLVQELNFYAIT